MSVYVVRVLRNKCQYTCCANLNKQMSVYVVRILRNKCQCTCCANLKKQVLAFCRKNSISFKVTTGTTNSQDSSFSSSNKKTDSERQLLSFLLLRVKFATSATLYKDCTIYCTIRWYKLSRTAKLLKSPLLNPLNPELNPICYLLALLGAHHFLHVSRIRVKLLTFRLLMSYIYGAPILDVSRSHTTTQHSR